MLFTFFTCNQLWFCVDRYPAVSAYVTAVGGTEFVPDANALNGNASCRIFGNQNTPFQNTSCVQEAAISISIAGSITSGGGFANTSVEGYSPIPDWQASVVQAYLDSGSYAASTGRGTTPALTSLGRGYPDISGFAGNIGIVVDGVSGGSGGTSASAPFLAGVISVLNSHLISAGKGYVGFLNPTLYAAHSATQGAAFNDVIVGDINCRGQNSPGLAICCSTGYSAIPGWDPATGLGSINFGIFRDYVVSTMPNSRTTRWQKPPTTTGGAMCATTPLSYLGTPCESKPTIASTEQVIIVVAVILVTLVFVALAIRQLSRPRGDTSKGVYLTVGHAHFEDSDSDSESEDYSHNFHRQGRRSQSTLLQALTSDSSLDG